LQAGVGYGGSCFPKDVNAFRETMKQFGVQGLILDAVEKVNFEQKKITSAKGKKIAKQ
jgi:UDPglucose 6-dehydrogenase